MHVRTNVVAVSALAMKMLVFETVDDLVCGYVANHLFEVISHQVHGEHNSFWQHRQSMHSKDARARSCVCVCVCV